MTLILKPLVAEIIQVLRERTGRDLCPWEGNDEAYPTDLVTTKAKALGAALEQNIEGFHAPELIITVEEYRAHQIVDWLILITREYTDQVEGVRCQEPLRCCRHWIIVIELMITLLHAMIEEDPSHPSHSPSHSILSPFAASRAQFSFEEFSRNPIVHQFLSSLMDEIMENGYIMTKESVHLIKCTLFQLAHTGAPIGDIKQYLDAALKKAKSRDHNVPDSAVQRIVNEIMLRFGPSDHTN